MSDYIPADVRRKLRQEANYGCALCGSPLLEHHHIIPRRVWDHNDPDHMIALCPTHHRIADDGAISRGELYDLKDNPYNESKVDYPFHFDSDIPRFNVAELTCEIPTQGTYTAVRINERDLFKVRYEDEILTFDLEIYDTNDQLIAEVTNNEWNAYTDNVWDIVHKSKELKIWDPNQTPRLKLIYDSGLIHFEGKFYYDGERLDIYPLKVTSSRGGTVKGEGKIIVDGPPSYGIFQIDSRSDGIRIGQPFDFNEDN